MQVTTRGTLLVALLATASLLTGAAPAQAAAVPTGSITFDGTLVTGPDTVWVIGDPAAATPLPIPGIPLRLDYDLPASTGAGCALALGDTPTGFSPGDVLTDLSTSPLSGAQSLTVPKPATMAAHDLYFYAACFDATQANYVRTDLAHVAYRASFLMDTVVAGRSFPSANADFARPITETVITGSSALVSYVLRNAAGVRIAHSSSAGTRHTFTYQPTSSRTVPAGRYQLIASIPRPDGVTVTDRRWVTVTWGWTPYFYDGSTDAAVAYPACKALTWALDTRSQPSAVRATSLINDLTTAFSIAARATGLTFTRTTPAKATIVVSWAYVPTRNDAYGGSTFVNVPQPDGTTRSVFASGSITLAITSSWLRVPGWANSNGGLGGRGPLLLHEIGHVLGLGHVGAVNDLMTPWHYFPVTGRSFSSGSLAGLRDLYAPASCPAWSAAAAPKADNGIPVPTVVTPAVRNVSRTVARISWSTPTSGAAGVRTYYVLRRTGHAGAYRYSVVTTLTPSTRHASLPRPTRGTAYYAIMIRAVHYGNGKPGPAVGVTHP